MGDAFRAHLATVGATALDVAPVDAADTVGPALPALLGDEAHVQYLASVLGRASTASTGRVVSLDARRVRTAR